jgi:serine protease Do
MLRASFACMWICLFLGPGASAQSVTAANAPVIALTRTVVTIPVGQKYGHIGAGIGSVCAKDEVYTWDGRRELDPEEFQAQFVEELRKSGLLSPSVTENLFETESSNEDFAVAAVISDMKFDACMFAYNYSSTPYNGTGEMTVEWQVYSRLSRRVVAKVTTSAKYAKKGLTQKGTMSLLHGAFAANASKLLASPEFRAGLASTDAVSGTTTAEAILIAGAVGTPTTVSDGVGSVVAVFAGGGHGSGFLISEDGYLLTNQHVVGNLKQVRVRWSDGFEAVADVVRTDAKRDVALIKTGARRRMPLPLRIDRVRTGESLYAIGAPLDPQLQNTVTKGIASSSRIVDGLAYVQSDVAIQPGNSGGPLLDEQLRVVGIAAKGVVINGSMVGINMFIPIGDALEFLNIRVPAAGESAAR